MKQLLIIVLASLTLSINASLVVSNQDVITLNGSSYDYPYAWGCIIGSYFPLKYPSKTNYFIPLSRSGEDWGGWYRTEEEKWGLPWWASGASQVRNLYAADDNGSLSSNNVVNYGTNIANAPQLFWNGTAVTNEGYNFPMTFYYIGSTIHDASDGDSGNIARNAASLWLNGNYSTPLVDEWHMLWTNGWSADVVGARLLGFNAGSHPYQPGLLAMSVTTLTVLGADTNFGHITFDWTGISADTNQCAVTNLTKVGTTMSCAIKFDCMPPGFMYMPGTISNDCAGMFLAMPTVSKWFQWIIKGTNFPPGNSYTITVDSTNVDHCLGSALNSGRNWFTNTTGPLWDQRFAVYLSYLDLYGLSHDGTYQQTHSAGSPGSLGVSDMINYYSIASSFYDTAGHRGTQYVADMQSVINAVKTYTTNSYTISQPTVHIMSITEDAAYTPAPFR